MCYYLILLLLFYFELGLISPIPDKTLSPKTYPTPLTIKHLTLCPHPKTFSPKLGPKPKALSSP